jgi:hypothetical protein
MNILFIITVRILFLIKRWYKFPLIMMTLENGSTYLDHLVRCLLNKFPVDVRS